MRHIAMVVLAVCSLHCAATEQEPKDTIYFYDTWQQMLDNQPVEMLIQPLIDVYSHYEVYFSSYNKDINKRILSQHIAISMGDSIWLINSHYLRKGFAGTQDLQGYIPVFFNDKVAYIVYHASLSTKEILNGVKVGENGEYLYNADYFYIDFLNHRVERVTSDYLSKLLEQYHDLKMRYEGMKDYKKRETVEDYFLKYVDRATDDFMRSYIVDLVDD